jgi:hypothetical protein
MDVRDSGFGIRDSEKQDTKPSLTVPRGTCLRPWVWLFHVERAGVGLDGGRSVVDAVAGSTRDPDATC